MNLSAFLSGVALLTLAVSPAWATPSTPSPSPTPGESWKLPSLAYFIEKLPPPPRTGSFRDRMDLRDAIAIQRGVTPKQLKHIQETYLFSVFTFSRVYGPDFNAQKYPKTALLFAKLINTANVVVNGLKNHYKRLRPFEAHPQQIKLLVKNEPGYSYPSGHTTRSRLCAMVVAELDPAQRAAIFNSAEHVALDRIMGGEHYLTDLEGGRTLGKMLFGLLSKDPQFQRDLAEVKAAEWTPPPTPIPLKKDNPPSS